jgi:hypothetical protein
VILKDGKASSKEDCSAIEYGCGCGLPKDKPSVKLSPKQRIWSEFAKSILSSLCGMLAAAASTASQDSMPKRPGSFEALSTMNVCGAD